MSIEATFDPAHYAGDSDPAPFKQVGPDLAFFQVVNDDSLGPITTPELLPAGWRVSDAEENPVPVFCENGDYVELYILERTDE